jgi:hypothetical protein
MLDSTKTGTTMELATLSISLGRVVTVHDFAVFEHGIADLGTATSFRGCLACHSRVFFW